MLSVAIVAVSTTIVMLCVWTTAYRQRINRRLRFTSNVFNSGIGSLPPEKNNGRYRRS